VYEGAGGPVVAQAPYVESLSTNALAGAVAAVLTTSFGSESAGLYLLFNNRWNFVAPYVALNNFIISGGQIAVYAGLLSPVTPTAGATVYRNGVQSSATTLTTDPVVWATVLVDAAGGYVLPAASASVLGGVKQGTGVTIAGDGTISVSSAGTVTSVAMTIPSILTLTGTPITTAGTLALGLATQAPAIVFAGPLSGANAVPTFRALATTDIPALPYAPTASPTFTGTTTIAGLTVTGGATVAAVTASGLILANGGLTVPVAETATFSGAVIAAAATSFTVPTAAVNTNSTAVASTAFVVGQAATVAPVIDGAATVGVSLLYARQDHVHPTDTSRAPTANPTFTGTVGAAAINASGQISTTVAGSGLTVKGGTNAKIGVATLVAGTVTVANTAVTANSRIFYNQQSGALTGIVTIAITAGTGFTLTSTINTDTAVIAYFIVEQS
jgi:hypothetical protein